MAFPHFRKWRYTALHIEVTPSEHTTRTLAWLEHLAVHPDLVASLLHTVVAETLVRGVRERFLQHLPNAMEMHTLKTTAQKRVRHTEEMAEMSRLYDTLQRFERAGDARGIAATRTRLTDARARYRESLQLNTARNPITASKFSSGLFRSRALEVLNELTDGNLMRTKVAKSSLVVQVGNQQRLGQIKTPSATEFVLRRHKTTSRYQTLWRHLEFGTGVYSSDPEGKGNKAPTRYSGLEGLPPWHWAYSPNPPQGLILRGSHGVHALRNQFGVTYTEDARAFHDRFIEAFTRLLAR